MRIFLDMDGVLCDIVTPWLKEWERQSGRSHSYEDVKGWSFPGLYEPEEQDLFYSILYRPGFFLGMEPICGAIEGTRYLCDVGHDVWVATTPFHSRTCMYEKWSWITAHLPELSNKVIFTSDKGTLRGDLLIDDYEKNVQAFKPACLLFDQPWNRHFDQNRYPVLRVEGWPGVLDFFNMSWAGNTVSLSPPPITNLRIERSPNLLK